MGCKEEDNVHKNFELLFTTLAVLTIELANEDVIVDLIRLAIALQVNVLRNLTQNIPVLGPLNIWTIPQEMSLANEENLPMFNRCGVMALVAAYLNFLSQMIANPPFCQHISKVSEVPPFLLLLVPASDGSLFSGDRAEEPDGAVSAPRTRVQRQVSVSLRLVDLKPPDVSWRTFSCPKTSDSIHQPEEPFDLHLLSSDFLKLWRRTTSRCSSRAPTWRNVWLGQDTTWRSSRCPTFLR